MTDVLVVDDDAFTRQGVCAYLESLQFGVGQAGDAAMGWQMAASYTPEGIAQRLYLAKGSVENHITQIYRKLGWQICERRRLAYGHCLSW